MEEGMNEGYISDNEMFHRCLSGYWRDAKHRVEKQNDALWTITAELVTAIADERVPAGDLRNLGRQKTDEMIALLGGRPTSAPSPRP